MKTHSRIVAKAVPSLNNPGRFCLYSMIEGTYYGNSHDTLDKAKQAAVKENVRWNSYTI